MSDYAGRIARLQNLMQEQGAAIAFLAGTDQMRYLTGWQEGGHERFVGLLVPAQGDPAFVVPAMNAPQARNTPAGIAQVLGWDDAAGWKGEVQALLKQWRIEQGGAHRPSPAADSDRSCAWSPCSSRGCRRARSASSASSMPFP